MTLTPAQENQLLQIFLGMFPGGESCGPAVPVRQPASKYGNAVFDLLQHMRAQADRTSVKLDELVKMNAVLLGAEEANVQKTLDALNAAALAARPDVDERVLADFITADLIADDGNPLTNAHFDQVEAVVLAKVKQALREGTGPSPTPAPEA